MLTGTDILMNPGRPNAPMYYTPRVHLTPRAHLEVADEGDEDAPPRPISGDAVPGPVPAATTAGAPVTVTPKSPLQQKIELHSREYWRDGINYAMISRLSLLEELKASRVLIKSLDRHFKLADEIDDLRLEVPMISR